MKRAVPARSSSAFFLLLLLLFSLAAAAAKLEVDRNEIAPGEIATVTLKGAPLIAVVEWKASPELVVVESSDKRVRVKGVREGSGSVRCELNMSVHDIGITVRRVATSSPPPAYIAPTYKPPVAPPDRDGLAGTWQITANGNPGRMELGNSQGALNGRVWFDAIGSWEPLSDLYFDAAINELSFTRPGANQSYRGQVQGNQMQGKFTQWGGRGYSGATPAYDWNASRAGAPPLPPPGGQASGLIAHLTMDGPVMDHVSGHPADNHGAQPTRDRQGHDGGALLFDGRSYLEIPLDINPGRRPQLTIAAWVRADSAQPIQQVASHDNGGYDRSLNIDSRGGGTGWSAFAGSNGVLGVKTVQVGKWTFVAATWDQAAQIVRLYVDGGMVEKSGSSGDGQNFLRIGMNPGFGEYFKGAIDELWVFDQALGQNDLDRLRGHDKDGAFGDAGQPARITAFTWKGMGDDKVGEWGSGSPNGVPDGRFRLVLDLPDPSTITSISVWSATDKGEKAGGQVWHSKNGSYWMLGVFRDGRQLNASHIASLGNFSGKTGFDLYANSSGWFNPGQYFLVEVETGDGRIATRLAKVGAPPVHGGGGGGNLALNKTASQSSRSQWSRPNDAQGAVDGVINGSYAFHTDNQPNPWWQVDLGGNYALGEVRLYNRLDCCAERARTVQVMLSGDGRNWRTVYRHDGGVFGGKDGRPLRVPLNGEKARFVRLQLNETTWFHLDEVEVMGMDAGQANDTGATLKLDRDRYAPGEAIVIGFTAPASFAGDAWIGIIPSRIPHGSEAVNDQHDLVYQYVQKRTSGTMTFTAPTVPGNYDLRLHDTDANGREVASVSFTVDAPAPYDGGRGYTADRPGPVPGGAPNAEDELQRQLQQLRDMYKR